MVQPSPDSRQAVTRRIVARTVAWAAGAALLAIAAAWLFGARAGAERWVTATAAALVILAIALLAAYRARRGLAAMERMRGLQAQIAIYRVGDVLARAESDEELVRCALDAVASGSGLGHWAMYLREPLAGALHLFATRGLPPEASRELEPDAIGRTAQSPASRAAWQGEAVVSSERTGASPAPEYSFPSQTPGLGPAPTVVSVPLIDGTETVAVLQCFLPGERAVEAHDLALIRWMATQVSVGLKRIRMERRDQMLAHFTMGTGEILMGLDLAGAVTYANAAAERALGASSGGLTGRPLEAVAVFGAGEGPFALAGASEGGREFSGEVWFLRGDLTRFPAEVRISPTYDRHGNLSALVLVGHDVTERREREAELTSRTQELGLLNEQLQRAVTDLEEARRAQSEFVANTSHELRTPLNAVIGFATLIEQANYESDEEARDFALRIRRSAEHLLGLLNDILDLAKVEAGRFQLSMTLADLRDPIREALEAVAPLAAGRGLRLDPDLPDDPLHARFDPVRVRQVVMNLLGNALKYTDKGNVRVCAWRDDATGESRIQVVDTGLGISKEGQRRLFAKFGRVDLTLAGRRAGTGLGLAISKALIQGMGGSITVESDGVGRGTRATVVFPAPPAEPVPE